MPRLVRHQILLGVATVAVALVRGRHRRGRHREGTHNQGTADDPQPPPNHLHLVASISRRAHRLAPTEKATPPDTQEDDNEQVIVHQPASGTKTGETSRRTDRRSGPTGLKDSLPERLALARQQQMGHAAFLELLLSDELTRRESRSAMLRAAKAGLDPDHRRANNWTTARRPESYDRTL